jgi:murein DD-endopeptidase MepM/ murein hydrolase activator NlpD
MDRQEEDADNDIGWVRQNNVKLKSQCAGYKDPSREDESAHEEHRASSPSSNSNTGDNVSGLTDADCCLFPLASSAQVSFTEGMRKFGWNRSGGRKHAAADLYHRDYEPIYAIADGEILRDREAFYGGTSATEIRHSGGFVARYGEIASPGQKPGLVLGSTVKAGDLIGYMKATKSKRGYNHPMLHFELYTGKRTGALTPPADLDLPNENYLTAFKRRADLINPTAYLLKWESKRR